MFIHVIQYVNNFPYFNKVKLVNFSGSSAAGVLSIQNPNVYHKNLGPDMDSITN